MSNQTLSQNAQFSRLTRALVRCVHVVNQSSRNFLLGHPVGITSIYEITKLIKKNFLRLKKYSKLIFLKTVFA